MANNMHSSARLTNTHTTMIGPAEVVVREGALKDPCTTRVTLGLIKRTKRNAGGAFWVKFRDINGGILMHVRGNMYVQQIRVYTNNIQKTRTNLARFVRSKGMSISFGESKRDSHDD